MTRTLLSIAEDLRALDDLLEEVGGDVSDPRVEEAISKWESELSGDLTGKVNNYCHLIRELEASAEFRAGEAERLRKRAKADQSKADFLRGRLKLVLEQRGLGKLETDHYRLSIQKNGGAVPLVLEAPAMIPPQYMRVIPEQHVPDNEKLREALAAGQEVPGVRLGERGTRLSIR